MARNLGTFNFSANYEVVAKAPLDAKTLVDSYSGLTEASTWDVNGNNWLFNGAVVSVGSDPDTTKNGIYRLTDADNFNIEDNWVKIADKTEVETADVTHDRVTMWTGATATPDNPVKLNTWYDNTQSAGRFTGGDITENNPTTGTVDVSAGTGLIKLDGTGEEFLSDEYNDDRNAINKYVTWDALTVQLEAGYNYIYYDAALSGVTASTDSSNIENNVNFNLGRVFWDNVDSEITIRLCGQNLWNLNRRIHRVGDELFGVQRASGLVTTNPSDRYIQVSGGVLWAELLNRFETTDFNSSDTPLIDNTFKVWYQTGSSAWGSKESNEIADEWNDGFTLNTGVTSGYTVHWVYVVHDSSVHVVLHNETYSGITEARLSKVRPELPSIVSGYATLSARIIQNAADATITEIGSSFDQVFDTTIPAQHNDLGGIDGSGTFHLSSAQVIDVNDIPTIHTNVTNLQNNKLDESIFDSYTGTTNTRLTDVEEVTAVALTGSTNGLTDTGRVVELGGTLTKNTTITASAHSLTFIDNRSTTLGIQYNADYSANYNARSLVDKGYVDAVATGLQPKSGVMVATTGDTTLSGIQTVDGVTLSHGNRVLVKDQTNAVDNGIYEVNSGGTWTRTLDFDGKPGGEVVQSAIVPVVSGSTNANTIWLLTTPDPITVSGVGVIDPDELNFTQFAQQLDIVSGNGIEITTTGGQQEIAVELDATYSGLSVDNNGLKINDNIAGTGLNVSLGVISLDTSAVGLLTADNGLTTTGQNVQLGGTLIKNTTITLTGNSLTIQDDRGLTEGILYADDYSVDYTNRSLVDKGYVTGLTSALESDITNLENNKLDESIFDSYTGTTNITLTNLENNKLDESIFDSYTGTTNITLTNLENNKLDESVFNIYTGDTQTTLEEITGVTSVALTGSTNGLTDTGRVVELGGTLTKDTTIDAQGNELNITNNNLFSVILSSNTKLELRDESFIVTGATGITLTGEITLNDTPTAITNEAFSVLVRDDSNGEVKTVDGAELGEDNNSYFITTASTSITGTTDMYVILVDTSGGAVTFTLPASPNDGQAYKIKDVTGDAITNNITIDGNGKNVDNSSTALINTDYGAIEVAYDSNYDKWVILSFVN